MRIPRVTVEYCAPRRVLILLAAQFPKADEPPDRFIIDTSIPRMTRNTRIPTFPAEDSDETNPSIIT